MAGALKRLLSLGKAKVDKAISAEEDKDPIMMIEAGLSEARKHLSEYESAVQETGAEKIRLEKEGTRIKEEVKLWGKNAKTALEEGGKRADELATTSFERQTIFETELEGIQSQYKMAKKGFETMTSRLLEQKSLIKNQESKMGSLKAKNKAAQANLKMRETISKFEGSGNSFDQISRFEDKVNEDCNRVEAADAMDEVANGEDLDSQFEKMESKSAVSDKLAALKASMK